MSLRYPPSVERWCVFEVCLSGPSDGNPYTEQSVRAAFTGAQETVRACGFYDGDGVYRVRFMPSFEGAYTFVIESSFADAQTGTFTVTPASPGNHGPVRVSGTYHFAYEDGTPHFSIGTTCYAWTHQPDALVEETLATLADSAFNKIRFCILPKHYIHNFRDPVTFPWEGTPVSVEGLDEQSFLDGSWTPARPNEWDFTRFVPEHFRRIERCIERLMALGIEADLIVMHPYDRWGFSKMTKEQDDLYWKYVVARFAAYRNVWWSLANEYDLMAAKAPEDWERYAAILMERDPYRHLRSVHNCLHLYDFTRPWVTHCSVQRVDVYKSCELVDQLRERYGKPVVMDEICYEGDIDQGWGNITGQELVRRFWEATVRGGYAGHGETFLHPDDILWWSHGGTLHGESGARLRFLRDFMATLPTCDMRPAQASWDVPCAVPEREVMRADPSFQLHYFGFFRPRFRDFRLPEGARYAVQVVDTWNMTVEDRGVHKGRVRVELPGREYMAVCPRRIQN